MINIEGRFSTDSIDVRLIILAGYKESNNIEILRKVANKLKNAILLKDYNEESSIPIGCDCQYEPYIGYNRIEIPEDYFVCGIEEKDIELLSEKLKEARIKLEEDPETSEFVKKYLCKENVLLNIAIADEMKDDKEFIEKIRKSLEDVFTSNKELAIPEITDRSQFLEWKEKYTGNDFYAVINIPSEKNNIDTFVAQIYLSSLLYWKLDKLINSTVNTRFSINNDDYSFRNLNYHIILEIKSYWYKDLEVFKTTISKGISTLLDEESEKMFDRIRESHQYEYDIDYIMIIDIDLAREFINDTEKYKEFRNKLENYQLSEFAHWYHMNLSEIMKKLEFYRKSRVRSI